jgi:5'-nucleotidase
MKNIVYSNKKEFLKILKNIKKDWLENLHILADFDRTLTKAFSNSEDKRWKWISVFKENSLWFDKDFCKLEQKNFEKYYPIENNPDLSLEEKNKFMLEWWKNTFELFIKFGLTKDKIKKAVFNWKIEFREKVEEFCKFLDKNNVPLIIISASGLWHFWVEYFFEKKEIFYENIEIISNNFIWDKSWKAIWYKKPIIHSFNKSETVLKNNKNIYSKIKNRKNIILLWDSLWDHHMVDWFNYYNLIKIWFLNDNEDKLLSEYKKRYDIIITWDWDFDIVNQILEEIK